MKRSFSIWLAVLGLLAACQGTNNTGLSSRAGVTYGADASICQPLADQVARAQTLINTCNTNADCVLTTNVPSTGYSCEELGVGKSADQTALWSALHAFVAAGCNAQLGCLMMMASTDQPCIAHQCVNSDQYSN